MVDKDKPMGCLWFLFRPFGGGRGDASAATSTEFPYRLRVDFLSAAELAFYRVLEQAVGGRYAINAKVRLGDLLYVPRQSGSQPYENKIRSKHVDFLLCDLTSMRPLLVIELDDASHNRKDRQERDELVDRALAAAGLPILHVKARRTYSIAELSTQLDAVLPVPAKIPPSIASEQIQPEFPGPSCPKCSVAMAERTAAKGKHAGKRFWSCSNYPQCREKIAID